MGGYVPMPDVSELQYLLNYFFRMGPATKDGPLDMREVRSWAPALAGQLDWEPWQAELFVNLSRAYCAAQQEAADYYAPPPWDEAVKMWQWVRSAKAERRLDQDEAAIAARQQENPPDGNRKRR